MLLLFWAQMGQAIAAECPEPTRLDAVVALSAAAESAYAARNPDGFRGAVEDLALDVPCLGELATPALAAAYHRARGLDLFAGRRQEQAAGSFAAARSIEPEHAFLEGFPAGHPVREVYGSLAVSDGGVRRVAPATVGSVAFDGIVGSRRPTGWPTLFQVLAADGSVRSTQYVMPGDTLEYPHISPALRARKLRIGLLTAGAASAVVAGTTYIAAAGALSGFSVEDATTLEELEGRRRTINGLVAASWVFGIGAAGLGVGAALVPRPLPQD